MLVGPRFAAVTMILLQQLLYFVKVQLQATNRLHGPSQTLCTFRDHTLVLGNIITNQPLGRSLSARAQTSTVVA